MITSTRYETAVCDEALDDLQLLIKDQTDWFLQESSAINQIERPFRPDTAKDFGHLWHRDDQLLPQTRKLAKPNAMMFFHIPL
jgi:hypothetical protein